MLRSMNSRAPRGGASLLVVPSQQAGVRVQEEKFCALRKTHVDARIDGPFVSLTYSHHFVGGAGSKNFEVQYRLPVPTGAVVQSCELVFGDTRVAATLKEREEAQYDYDAAQSQGQQAGLVTKMGNVFTMNVSGVRPGERVRVETEVHLLAQPGMADGEWMLRIPLTMGPKFSRADEGDTSEAQPHTALRVDHRFSFTARAAVESISSPTHDLDVTAARGEKHIRLGLQDGIVPDKDFVLYWDAPGGSFARVYSGKDYDYALVYVRAPASATTTMPRNVVLAKDNSGSMNGPKWRAANYATRHVLRDLGDDDTFALGLFQSQIKWFENKALPATAVNTEAASRFIADHDGWRGGTQLGMALEQAQRYESRPGAANHIVLITDAEVTDLRPLSVVEQLGDYRYRVSVVSIDAAANDYLVNELARRGGGMAYFLTSNPDSRDITAALMHCLKSLQNIAYDNARIRVSRPAISPRYNLVQNGVFDFGTLPSGVGRWMVARVEKAAGLPSFVLETDVVENIPTRPSSNPAIRSFFGHYMMTMLVEAETRRDTTRVNELLRMLDLTPAPPTATVYPENADDRDDVQDAVIELSLEYGILSDYTAFVAVNAETYAPVDGRVTVANALPAGWQGAAKGISFLSAKAGGAVRSVARSGEPTLESASFGVRGIMPATASAPSAPDKTVTFEAGEKVEVEMASLSGILAQIPAQGTLRVYTADDNVIPALTLSLADLSTDDEWPVSVSGAVRVVIEAQTAGSVKLMA